jgi:chromosome segregation ATPase
MLFYYPFTVQRNKDWKDKISLIEKDMPHLQTKSDRKKLAKIISKSIDWVDSKMIHLKVYNSLPEKTKNKAKNLSTDKMKVLKNLPEEEKENLIQSDNEKNLSTKKFKEEAKKIKTETSRFSEKVTKKQPTKKEIELKINEINFKIEALKEEKEKLEKQIRELGN